MKFVFCEGKDDVAVVKGLAAHLKLDLLVEGYGGKDQLPDFLKSLHSRPEFARQAVDAMAILRDADQSEGAALQSVTGHLQQNNFPCPEANAGFADGTLRVGVFIVGVNGMGMIEDLCLSSVADRPEFPCVDSYFACITEKSGRKPFSPKAKVRVWMASHTDFDLRVGKAAEAGYWPWESPAFDSLKAFLQAL